MVGAIFTALVLFFIVLPLAIWAIVGLFLLCCVSLAALFDRCSAEGRRAARTRRYEEAHAAAIWQREEEARLALNAPRAAELNKHSALVAAWVVGSLGAVVLVLSYFGVFGG